MDNINNLLRTMDFNFFGKGKHKISPEAFFSLKDAVFLDIRSEEEIKTLHFDLERLCETIHIPVNEIPDRISEIPRDKPVGIFCSSGVRSAMIYLYLRALGFELVRSLEGGYTDFVNELKPGKLMRHRSKRHYK